MSKQRITRRRFSSGVLAAGALAVTSRSARGKVSGADRIQAAVIGCRNRGWQNAANFQASGRFDVVTLCDCDSAMIDLAMNKLKGKLPRTPAFEKDFREVLEDKSVDAVINATPDHWHALITVLALDAGKHVFLEKPASYNIDDGKAMVAAQKRHPDLTIAIGTQQRSGAHFLEAKQFIDSGGLGKIGFARAWLSGGRHKVPFVPDGAPPASLDYDMWVGPAAYRPYNKEKVHYNWHFMKDFGTGDAGNWGAHWLDIVRWFADLDLPTSVSAFGGQYMVKDAKEWPDTQTALFHYPELTVVWEMRHWTSLGVNGRGTGAELRGDKGSMVVDRGGWTFYPKEGKPEKHDGSALDGPHVKNFAECIAGSAPPAASIADGHKTAILCHLANISTVFNRQLAFDPAAETIRNDPQASRYQGRRYRLPWRMPA